MSDMDEAAVFAIQSLPPPNESRSGSGPVGELPCTLRSSSLSLKTTLSGITETQTKPPPTAMSLAQPWSFVWAVMLFSTGSIFVTRPLSGRTAQIALSAKTSERQPERAGAERETRPDRLSLEREATGDLAGSLVDPQKPGAEVLSDPDRARGRQETRAWRERQL